MPDLGVHLSLFVGPSIPLPAPYPLTDSLVSVEVTNDDRQRDGFKLEFSLGKDTLLDYSLLASGLLDPPNIVTIIVTIGALPQVLINGMITQHQFIPSNKPGDSRLHVTGEDIGLKFDLEERSDTYPNRPDSIIVTRIVLDNGLVPKVTPTTNVPIEVQIIPTQQGTNLEYIQQLAKRNGFVFYTEPTFAPGISTAYWGPENRLGIPQAALSVNMGADTNIDTPINFSFNALGPATPQVTIVDPLLGLTIPIPVPTALRPPLVARPATSLRKTIARDGAGLSMSDGILKAAASVTDSADAVTATGTVDAVRYGRAMQSRRLIGVRGVGLNYDGLYYVKQVKHNIKRGEYKQNFTLSREGRIPLTPFVVP
jgi:hypothetical protein